MNAIFRTLVILTVVLGVTAIGLTMTERTSAQDEEPEWTESMPSGGPALELAITSRDDDLVQGLFAASTEVMSSTRASDWLHVPGTGPVNNVAGGPDGVIYAATVEGRGYRSTTYGRSWRRISVRGDAPMRFMAISPDYGFDDTAYAIILADWRLYRTTNDAGSWQEVKMEADVEDQIGAVAFSPLYYLDEIVFVGTDRGVFKWSADNRRWTLMSEPDGGTPAFGQAGGPASSQGIVVPYEYGDDPLRKDDPVLTTIFAYNTAGVYRSDDEGATWTQLTLPAQVERVNGFDVSNGWPRDPVLVAAVKAPDIVGVVSHDNGANWEPVSGTDGLVGTDAKMARDFAPIPEPDEDWAGIIHMPIALQRAELGGVPVPPEPPFIGSREMYISTDGGGVFRSDDEGYTWSPPDPTYTAVRVTGMELLPGGGDADALAGSLTAGLFRSDDGGRNWLWVDSGLPRGAEQIIYDIRATPTFETDKTIFVVAASGLWVSRDGGLGWEKTSVPQGVQAVDISPAYATDGSVLASGHLSTDRGVTWTPMSGIGASNWRAVAFSAGYAEDNTIYAGTDLVDDENRYGLFRSEDGGATWGIVEDSTLSRSGILSLYSARYDPGEDVRVFAGTARGLVASYDGGAEWDRQGAISKPVHDVTGRGLREPFVTGVVLAAHDDGASWSTNRGSEWTREPRSPKLAWGGAVSEDGTVLLIGIPSAVSRFEVGD